jgi:hypothetical protein
VRKKVGGGGVPATQPESQLFVLVLVLEAGAGTGAGARCPGACAAGVGLLGSIWGEPSGLAAEAGPFVGGVIAFEDVGVGACIIAVHQFLLLIRKKGIGVRSLHHYKSWAFAPDE